MSLPVKLIDTITESLSNDVQVLAACSLVCRSWSAVARSYRFHEVRAGLRAYAPGMLAKSRLASLLCDPTSAVLLYVRCIYLNTDDYSRTQMSEAERVEHNLVLDEILQEIRVQDPIALESLRTDDVVWSVLSAPSRRALQHLAQHTTSLRFDYPDFGSEILLPIPCSAVAQLLGAVPSLQHFTVFLPGPVREEFEEEGIDAHTQSSWPEKLALESFEVTDESASYLSCLPVFFPTIQLRKLSLGGFHRGCVLPLITFLNTCATTLECLSLTLNWHSDGRTEGVFLHFFSIPASRLMPPAYQRPYWMLRADFQS